MTTLVATNQGQNSKTGESRAQVQILEANTSHLLAAGDTSIADSRLFQSLGDVFGGTSSRNAFASTARIAGRMNAASVREEDYQKLLAERQYLLDQKFSGEATRQMLNRLEYVRWSLDRIEDARYGVQLDALEAQIERLEEFKKEIASLEKILTTHLPSSHHTK